MALIVVNGQNCSGMGLNVIEITQAEYDKLGDFKKSDGQIYHIIDADPISDNTKADKIKYVNTNSNIITSSTVQGAIDHVDSILSNMKVENLIPYPYYETTVTKNGITFTDNGDGTITIEPGTATAQTDFSLVSVNTKDQSNGIYLENGEKYSLSGCPTGGSSSTFCIHTNYIENENWHSYGRDYGKGITFTGNGKKAAFIIRIFSGAVITEPITFKPMLVKGHVSCPYVPYNLGKEKLREDINTINSNLINNTFEELGLIDDADSLDCTKYYKGILNDGRGEGFQYVFLQIPGIFSIQIIFLNSESLIDQVAFRICTGTSFAGITWKWLKVSSIG